MKYLILTLFLFTSPVHAWTVCSDGWCMNEADYISDIAMQEKLEEHTVEELENQAKSDVVVGWMMRLGIPVTRKNYLGLNYPEGLTEEWTAELESMLPPCVQDFSKVKQD
jgi:hypothetical protein